MMGENGQGTHRRFYHDYRGKDVYHITLLKRDGVPAFGAFAAGWREAAIQRRPEDVNITLSDTGKAVRDGLFNLTATVREIRLLRYAVMPDHVHLLLQVMKYMDEPLGNHIARMKAFVNERWAYRLDVNNLPAATERSVFARGFNDQILWASRSLSAVFDYVRLNPYKLALRKAYPDYFTRLQNLSLTLDIGTACHPSPVTFQAYGNLQLLTNPFKEPVAVHRADTDEQKEKSHREWVRNAANGGVLVSPFISPAEREIFDEADALGGRFIKLTTEPIHPRDNAHGADFERCAQGRLLLLHPAALKPQPALTRSDALLLNSLASALVKWHR